MGYIIGAVIITGLILAIVRKVRKDRALAEYDREVSDSVYGAR